MGEPIRSFIGAADYSELGFAFFDQFEEQYSQAMTYYVDVSTRNSLPGKNTVRWKHDMLYAHYRDRLDQMAAQRPQSIAEMAKLVMECYMASVGVELGLQLEEAEGFKLSVENVQDRLAELGFGVRGMIAGRVTYEEAIWARLWTTARRNVGYSYTAYYRLFLRFAGIRHSAPKKRDTFRIVEKNLDSLRTIMVWAAKQVGIEVVHAISQNVNVFMMRAYYNVYDIVDGRRPRRPHDLLFAVTPEIRMLVLLHDQHIANEPRGPGGRRPRRQWTCTEQLHLVMAMRHGIGVDWIGVKAQTPVFDGRASKALAKQASKVSNSQIPDIVRMREVIEEESPRGFFDLPTDLRGRNFLAQEFSTQRYIQRSKFMTIEEARSQLPANPVLNVQEQRPAQPNVQFNRNGAGIPVPNQRRERQVQADQLARLNGIRYYNIAEAHRQAKADVINQFNIILGEREDFFAGVRARDEDFLRRTSHVGYGNQDAVRLEDETRLAIIIARLTARGIHEPDLDEVDPEVIQEYRRALRAELRTPIGYMELLRWGILNDPQVYLPDVAYDAGQGHLTEFGRVELIPQYFPIERDYLPFEDFFANFMDPEGHARHQPIIPAEDEPIDELDVDAEQFFDALEAMAEDGAVVPNAEAHYDENQVVNPIQVVIEQAAPRAPYDYEGGAIQDATGEGVQANGPGDHIGNDEFSTDQEHNRSVSHYDDMYTPLMDDDYGYDALGDYGDDLGSQQECISITTLTCLLCR
jgi:hypothetical protein